MENDKLDKLEKNYKNIPIPKELDSVVDKALKGRRKKVKKNNYIKKITVGAASIAAALTIVAVGVNSSPAFAKTLAQIPVVGKVVNVLTFKEYNVDEDGFDADINVPKVEGLENKELENTLNEKYLEENKALYDQFMAEINELKKVDGGHLSVDSGYTVKTENDTILSIQRYVTETRTSSMTKVKYDTIDKEKEVLITLPSLFKDDSYVDVITKNIKEQMIKENKEDEGKIYMIKEIEGDGPGEFFEKISKNQEFYINDEGKLTISFNEYEVAPGYMGVVEFTIPTEILSDILVSDKYIK